MKRLNASERARILHLLCEGSSIRAVTRLTGTSKNTVIKLMIDAGKACAAYHDENVLNLAHSFWVHDVSDPMAITGISMAGPDAASYRSARSSES
jgi:hypothetical protein